MEHKMKAMILAAGKGTRVQPMTYDVPKPMIPLLGKPVMAYLVEHLAASGVTEIMVNVSYLHESIEQYFGDGHQFGVQIGYSFEGYTDDDGKVISQPLGSAGGMKKIQDFGGFFDDTTVVICGDAVIDLDLKAALWQHRRNGAMVSVITKKVPWEKVSSYGVVATDDQGKITQFQEKPAPSVALSNQVSTGIYIFEPEIMGWIPSGRHFDIGADLFPLLAKHGVAFYAQVRDFNWIDIGSISDYWEVVQQVMFRQTAGLRIPGVEIEEGIWVGLNSKVDWDGVTLTGPIYIGSGCHIEAGACIVGPAWIGNGSQVCSGARVERSILFDYTRVVEGAILTEQLVYKNYSIGRDGKAVHLNECTIKPWQNARDRRGVARSRLAA
jgi:mannose-1-phosphate guanylyltransferase